MLQNSVRKCSTVLYALIFSLYMFGFQLFSYLEGTVNGVLSIGHYFTYILLSSGFILFGAFRMMISGEKERQFFLIMTNILFAGAILGLLFPVNILPAFVLINIASLSLGCLGGAVYYFVAMELHMNIHAGMIMSVCASVPYILQFLMTPVLHDRLFNVILLALLTGVISFFVITNPKDYILQNPLPYSEETEDYKRSLSMDIFRVLSVFFLTMLLGVYMEQSWSVGQIADGVDMYGWQRLCAIPGYFFTGAFADHKKHKHLNIAVLCCYAFFAMGVYNAGNIGLSLAVFYFLAGVYTGYLNLAFWFLAPRTSHPEMWACLGRTLSLFEGLIGIAFFQVQRGGMLERLISGSILMCMFLLLYLDGQNKSDKSPALNEDVKAEDPFEAFCDIHNLTPRERDVMQQLLESDESMKTISTMLGISERMLYRYMNSLYEKVGAENRAGLVKRYYEGKEQAHQ